MPILIDTNIPLRSAQPSHPGHSAVVPALEVLMRREEMLVIALQNVAEFWNAATRPIVNNGLGFTIEETMDEAAKIEEFFQILTEDAASYSEWKTLVRAHRVSGAQVHDARLAAVMKIHGIGQIVTLNLADFARFPDVEAVHPDEISEA